MSTSISEQKGKPMTNIVIDRDTDDGGTKGQHTSNPADVDKIVKRAWQAIHEGAEGCIETAVDHFLDTYCSTVLKRKPFEVKDITAEMVHDSFSRTRESAGAFAGWSPKELSLLSFQSIRTDSHLFGPNGKREHSGPSPLFMREWCSSTNSEL